MDRDAAYFSSIPAEAREKVTQIWGDRSRKRAEYYRGKELVGVRNFHRTGELQSETPFQNGAIHGKMRPCRRFARRTTHPEEISHGRLLCISGNEIPMIILSEDSPRLTPSTSHSTLRLQRQRSIVV
jgi:hypothetical protein